MDEKYPITFIILSYTFSLINAFLIIYSQVFIKSNDNQSRLLKFRIFLLIAIDSFIIISKLIYKNVLSEVYYELMNTILFSLQFYEFISFVLDILSHIQLNKEYEIISPYIMSFICCLIVFPHYQFLYAYHVLILVIEIIIRNFCLICLYYYLKNISDDISTERKMKSLKLKISNNVSILLKICLLSLLFYNILQFGTIFFNRFYYDLILFSSRIGIKYIIFIISIKIISSFSKSNLKNISTEASIDIFNK